MSFFAMALTALQTVGSIMQGEAAGRQANQQADAAFQNAQIARQQGNAREEAQRRANALRMGDIRANAAQSGFDASTGSLATLQTKSAAEMELDALTGRYEAELQSISFTNEGNSLRAQARTARRTGYLNAAGSLLGGAAKVYGQQRIGPPAPVETRIPTPSPYYKG